MRKGKARARCWLESNIPNIPFWTKARLRDVFTDINSLKMLLLMYCWLLTVHPSRYFWFEKFISKDISVHDDYDYYYVDWLRDDMNMILKMFFSSELAFFVLLLLLKAIDGCVPLDFPSQYIGWDNFLSTKSLGLLKSEFSYKQIFSPLWQLDSPT